MTHQAKPGEVTCYQITRWPGVNFVIKDDYDKAKKELEAANSRLAVAVEALGKVSKCKMAHDCGCSDDCKEALAAIGGKE